MVVQRERQKEGDYSKSKSEGNGACTVSERRGNENEKGKRRIGYWSAEKNRVERKSYKAHLDMVKVLCGVPSISRLSLEWVRILILTGSTAGKHKIMKNTFINK